MPWPCFDEKCLRLDFVSLAASEGANIAELCRRYGISRKTGYKWLRRYVEQGEAGLCDRSRRPEHSPVRTADVIERAVVCVRRDHPVWGGRKIRQYLLNEAASGTGMAAASVPAASTISGILRRHGLIENELPSSPSFKRFEADAPNRLWQMDFKGHFALDGRDNGGGVRCHPFTILDDYSRYNLAVEACSNEQEVTVRERLGRVFERYGLPDAIINDNGPPWGNIDRVPKLTRLSVWLMRLGIKPLHSRPRHPQTLGKLERMHRALKAELLQGRRFRDIADAQKALQNWRHHYNHQRPHEALGGAVPASRYTMSRRPMPESLFEPEYQDDDRIRKVRRNGCIKFNAVEIHIAAAFTGLNVAVRPTTTDGGFDVWFANFRIARFNLAANINPPSVTNVLEQL